MTHFSQQFLEHWPQDAWAGRPMLVAVSGGADSIALLRLLADALSAEQRKRLFVVHLNHGLRGDESDADQQFVRETAERLGVNVRTRKLAAGTLANSGHGDGIEAAARSARYAFFREIAQEVEARYLVTAHHRNDQIETVLHRVFRGTGVAGLAGIAEAREWLPGVGLVRPLLPFAREEIVAYLNEIDQPWREDATNATNDFTRNQIRNELLPYLREMFGDSIDASIWRLSQQAADCQEVIDDWVCNQMDNAVMFPETAVVHVDLRKLAGERPYLVRELLVAIWRKQQWPRQEMTQQHWQKLSDLVTADTDGVADVLPGTIRAVRENDRLILSR